ncbi:MAG: SPOR domain-containing protein [Ignavibacteriae bacterium]|nr:SPOR domain-containing protein [Ignavibacteriota bacterium]
MPLILKDNDRNRKDMLEKPEPILHQPGESKTARLRRVVLVVVIITVIGGGIFLLYQSNLIQGFLQPSERTSVETIQQPPSITPDETTMAEADRRLKSFLPEGTGNLTVYIGSYPNRADAEEEVGRWKEAGYLSFVVEIPGWNRVALGRYTLVSEARQEAEKLVEAFEYGYWIGPIVNPYP